MIKIYLLPVEKDKSANTEAVKGIDYIHNAVLEYTDNPDIRKLIQNTSKAEHDALSTLALEVRDPTKEELGAFNALPPPSPPARDLAKEIDDLTARIAKLEKK